MIDLTVIFLTVNRVPETWAIYHKQILIESIEDYPLIVISRIPTTPYKYPHINILQTEPESSANIYVQMLKGFKRATTPYVAVAEDDVLYCREHFTLFRPPMDTFAYNMTRWSLFTFGEALFSYKHRIGNFALIAPRQLAIDALEERFRKYPQGWPSKWIGELGKPRTEKALGVTLRKSVEFNTTIPIVQFSHDYGIEEIQRKHTKRMGWIRAVEIPYWGRAEELRKKFI
jgi:hypothetical protein